MTLLFQKFKFDDVKKKTRDSRVLGEVRDDGPPTENARQKIVRLM